jgi:uncharacterized protein YndB with AHSA1/START domain
MADDTFSSILSVEIAASINRVWDLMTDIHSWPDWHPLLEAVSGELTAGSRIVSRLRSGQEQSAEVLVADLDEPFRFVYAAGDRAGVIGWHCWTLTELSPGTTRADNEERLSGPAIQSLTDEMRAGIVAQQRAIAAAFKRAAEAGGQP